MATIIPPQPNTEDMLALLSAYLDGEVTPAERAQVEQALAHSPEMTGELAELRQTVSMISALPKMAAPRPFTLPLADVTPATPPRKQRRWFAVPMWASGLAAMARVLACVLAAGGLFINRHMEGQPCRWPQRRKWPGRICPSKKKLPPIDGAPPGGKRAAAKPP
jgi:anti-sigma factor RsiW